MNQALSNPASVVDGTGGVCEMVDSRDKQTVLFLCPENHELALLSESSFNSEAARMELAWVARAGQVEENSLAGADLVVALSAPAPELQAKFAPAKERLEFWNIKAFTQPDQSIQNQIKNLVVRLILKGGKRKPLQSESSCSQCRQPSDRCTCSHNDNLHKKPEIIRVCLDTKGRRGKAVTIATGFSLDPPKLAELAASLKKTCGSGGTAKDGQIEIQGDHREKLLGELEKMGYRARRSGG
jgi:translation initiation factor 1